MSALSHAIGKAMIGRFEQAYKDYGESFNPDVVWEAVDEGIAALIAELTGQEATVLRSPGLIGSNGIKLSPDVFR